MGIVERKEKEKQEMQQLILDAAMKLFVEEGYANVSIRKIAEKIQYSPATIYLYFDDKETIFFTLQKIAFDKHYEVLSQCKSIPDPLARLIKNGELYVTFAMEHQEYYDLMFIMSATGVNLENKYCATDMRTYDLLKENLQACMDNDIIKKADVDTLALLLWSSLHGILSLIIRKRLVMIVEEQQKFVVNNVFEILKSLLRK